MRKRTSPIWTMPIEEFKNIVSKSNSLADIVRHFGISLTGATYRTLKKRLFEDNIDYSHIKLGRHHNEGRKFPSKSIPLSEVMIENSTYDRGSLKKRLLKDGIFENKCEMCGLEPIWENKELIMILDHINGIRNDHRKENLRFLCPNCNSQTKTFAGRKNKKTYYCEDCGRERKSKRGKICCKCSGLRSRRIKDRPSQEQLKKEIKETSCRAVGKKYGVSDKSIKKWMI